MKIKTILLLFGLFFTVGIATLPVQGAEEEKQKVERVTTQEQAVTVQVAAELSEVNAVEGGSTEYGEPNTPVASAIFDVKAESFRIDKTLIS